MRVLRACKRCGIERKHFYAKDYCGDCSSSDKAMIAFIEGVEPC